MRFSSQIKATLTLLCALITVASAREWKDATGRALEAGMLGFEQGRVVVQLVNKQRLTLPFDKLSEADKSWVRDWCKDKTPLQLLPAPTWPDAVQQPEIHVQATAHDQHGYVFKSPHYEFTCDAEVSASVMNDFATVAEGSTRLMESLPIHFPKADGKTFYARIYQSREGYARAGGPEGSGGVFITGDISGEGVLLVPFESLGIEQFAGRNTKSYDYKATVLIHEMVHQATAELLPLMPKWVAEGLAEYGANMTYRSGVFYLGERERVQSLRNHLEYYQKISRDVTAKVAAAPAKVSAGTTRMAAALPNSWVMRPSELVGKDETAWSTLASGRSAQIQLHRMYLSSFFLVYYYMHLADHGESRRLRTYFDDLEAVSLFIRSKGEKGRLPEELQARDRLSLGAIQGYFTSQLVGKDGTAALDADFQQRFTTMGVRISE